MMLREIFTAAQVLEILADAANIDTQVDALHARLDETGSVVPLRTLGIWENMRVDQRVMIMGAQLDG